MKGCTYGATLEELLNRPIGQFALKGSDGKDEDAKSDTDAGEDGDKDAKSGDADEKKDDDKKDDDGGKPLSSDERRRLKNLEEERERNVESRKEAQNEVKALKIEIAKLKRDGTPDDAIKAENETLTKTNATLVEQNTALRLQNAFLTTSGYDWVDPEAALALADLSEVEHDEKTGKVHGLKVALDKLAKAKPYLLKKATESDDKNDKDDKGKPTGRVPRSGGTKDSDEVARRAKLQAKYPGLRR